jgi:hypothetical protein
MRFKNALPTSKGAFIVLALCLFFLSSAIPKKKKDIQKLNYTIVFDLFLNYELSNKNGNLSTIVDYLPDFNDPSVLCERIESNMGREEEVIDFAYANGRVTEVNYTVRDRIFKYGIGYNNDLVDHMTVAGKNKIRFTYDAKGKIGKIERDMGEATMEYAFEYSDSENKADIVVYVIKGESRKKSPRKYHVMWDDHFRLKDYRLDVFIGHDYEYTPDGAVKSFRFSNVDSDNIPFVYEYQRDDKGNWIERTASIEKFYFRRKLKYQ